MSNDVRRWLKIAEGLLGQPTATGREQLPAQWIRDFVAKRENLALEEDRYGNLIVRHAVRAGAAPPLVLMAHLDHPGFIVREVRGATARLDFRGGVRLKHARRGTKLAFFEVGKIDPIGRGVLRSASSKGARPRMLGTGVADVTSGRAVEGGFTMWALPSYAIRGSRIVSRCIDDLLGAAAALATLDELHRSGPQDANVWGFFTRAEEIGLLGAFAGIKAKCIPKHARVLSLETSRTLPHARQGDGVIVRVGDARSVFEPRLTGAIVAMAAEMAKEDRQFRFQRRLMDGGSCEATAFCAAGYQAGGLALPLGNYHNMKGLDGGAVGIGAENVRVSDFVSEVRLLVQLASRGSELAELERASEDWVADLTTRAHEFLSAEPLRPRVRRAKERG
jgi:endoglucanase